MRSASKRGPIVLGIYLIVVGVAPYLPLFFRAGPVLSLLAVIAGVLILVDR